MAAGDFTTVVVVAGSFLRPVGGWLSDRIGGYRLLVAAAGGVRGCASASSRRRRRSASPWRCCSSAWALLGMGNGAVFQLVPQRFPERIGLVTGIVGAAGGLGGFFLPTLLGMTSDVTGGYAPGLLALRRRLRRRHAGAARARRALVAALGARGGRSRRRVRVSHRGAGRARRIAGVKQRIDGGVAEVRLGRELNPSILSLRPFIATPS